MAASPWQENTGHQIDCEDDRVVIRDGFSAERIVPAFIVVALFTVPNVLLLGMRSLHWVPVQLSLVVLFLVALLTSSITTLVFDFKGGVDVTHREKPFAARSYPRAQLRLRNHGAKGASLYIVSGRKAKLVRLVPSTPTGSLADVTAFLQRAGIEAPEPSEAELKRFVLALGNNIAKNETVWSSSDADNSEIRAR